MNIMKRHFIIPFLLFAFLGLNNAFSQWTHTNGPYGGIFHNIFEVQDSLLGVSSSDNFYRSGLENNYWVKSNLKLPARLNSVYKNDDELLFCTDNGVYRLLTHESAFERTFPGLPYDTVKKIFVNRGVAIASIFVKLTDGIYNFVVISKDSGATWNFLTVNGNQIGSDYFAATASGDTIFVGISNGICVTHDRGKTWHTHLALAYPNFTNINEIYIRNDTVFACSSKGVFYSIDYGQNWKNVPLLGEALSLSFIRDKIFAIYGRAGFTSLIKTGNGFESDFWGLKDRTVYNMIESQGKIYAATDAGCLVSKDLGLTWEFNNPGFVETYITSFASYKDTLLANLSTGGFSSSADHGETWSSWGADSLNYAFYSISMNDEIGYALTFSSNAKPYLSKTVNGGKSWNLDGSDFKSNGITSVLALPNGRALATVHGGIYESTDKGDSWRMIDSALTETIAYTLTSNSRAIFAGSNNGILKSTDEGLSWNYVDYQFDTGNDIGAVSNDDLVVAYTLKADLYISTDDGIGWTRIYPPFESISRVYLYGSNVIILAPGDNIYVSRDLGKTWEEMGPTTKGKGFYPLFILGDYIYAGTYQHGVYRAKLEDLKLKALNEPTAIIENAKAWYNPAKDIVGISPSGFPFTVEIFNSIGAKIQEYRNEENIDVSRLHSGIYLLTIRSKSAISFCKIAIKR